MLRIYIYIYIYISVWLLRGDIFVKSQTIDNINTNYNVSYM